MTAQINKKEKGFTLVEALVSVSIVLVGVTAVFTAAQLGISATSSVKTRVTVMFLAQEAQEAVKNIKDSNLHRIAAGQDIDWLTGITEGSSTTCRPNVACGYDVAGQTFNLPDGSNVLDLCNQLDDCAVKITSGDPIYRQTASAVGADTGLTREIIVREITPSAEAEVTVRIKKGSRILFEVKNVIYSWFEYERP